MTIEKRIDAFVSLGESIRQQPPADFNALCASVANENPWFTQHNVRLALDAITGWLSREELARWAATYRPPKNIDKTIAVVMAGNIPLAGFHDILCVLLSGYRLLAKPSSKDTLLFHFILKILRKNASTLADRILVAGGPLKNFDAAIATGSDNSSRYFQYYFGRFPSIIRKNRSSVAVLSGRESDEELKALGLDVFSYFGLGCRNVSKLLVPEGYSFDRLIEAWGSWKDILHHHKYANNYDYQKSILLVNRTPHIDAGFLLLKEERDAVVSPIATMFYATYRGNDGMEELLNRTSSKIQCIVGNSPFIPFGNAQYPGLNDYADKVDTMRFLSELGAT